MLMKFNIRGKKVEVTEPIRKYVENKLGKLDKYFEKSDELTANVLIRIRGNEQIVEVTIPAPKVILRAEESHNDLYAAIDLVTDKLERQIRKNKTRLHNKHSKVDFMDFVVELEIEPTVETKETIVKRKHVEMKPMDEEEAILQMELLGHEFFVFKEVSSGNTCVLYKRKDGNYGIIETN